MKRFRRFSAFLLSLLLLCACLCFPGLAKSKDDDDEDYSVSDVGFDVSDSRIYIYWTVGESKTQYKVELFKSSNMVTKNRVGDAVTVSYSAEKLDVTQRILDKGSGTYYARVTCKKKPRGETEYDSDIGYETISSDDLSIIRQNYRAEKAAAAAAAENPTSGSGVTGTAGGPGVSAGGSANPTTAAASGSASWVSLPDGQWAAVTPDGSRLTGWFSMDGKWYYAGEDGVMYASRWIESASEANVWYYVDSTGAMLVNGVTPDGYSVDGSGRYVSQ